MTVVYLLRHGATAVNRLVPYRLQGRGSDLPLDPTGRAQAQRAAEALAAIPIDSVYSSPLARAMETARIVGRPHGLEPTAVPELVEGDLGRWEGLTWDEAQARDPDHFARFRANPGTVSYPGGESFQDVRDRVAPAIERLIERHPGHRIAIVGHNIANRAYLAPLLGLPIDLARSLRQSNGGINVLQFDENGATVLTLNAALHLEGIA